MRLVIDSQIVVGYSIEIHNKTHNYTGAIEPIFESLGKSNVAYVDDNDIIENEWRNAVNNEWFEVWYTDFIRDGKIVQVPVNNYPLIISTLKRMNFPPSRDQWYVRVAKEISNKNEKSIIVSEDLDFFDPAQKNAPHKTREKIKKESKGPIPKFLKKENIIVLCVCNCPIL